MLLSAFVVLLSAIVSYFFLCLIIPSLQLGLLDEPNERSSHSKPTARGGGVVFVLIASFASALAWWTRPGSSAVVAPLLLAPLIALPLGIVGFLDDRYNLPAKWRFGFQLATSLLMIFTSPLINKVNVFFPVLALLLIAVTAVINFVNFMDGLDGLVAGCMAILMTAASIKLAAPWPVWVLVGALLGFLLCNWSPAKVFMGDVGSTFLGAVFALVVLQAPNWSEAFALLLVATPLLGDACLCVARRLISGQRVFQAHRLHLFQRLHQAGWPHARVSSLYIAATAVLVFALLLGGLPWVIGVVSLELFLGIWLDQRVAVPFVVASRS